MTHRSNSIRCGAALALLFGCSLPCLAVAQEADAVATAATGADDSDEGAIIVTAQRRDQNLQRVPIAITAVSAERLDQLNLEDVQSLQQVTPGLTYTTGISYAQTYIRGVGSSFTNPGLEPAVATYIDGAYLERGFGSQFDIVDPGSIQVLKGPQGTLWGRNATGGAILINTADPEFSKLGGRLFAEVGNLGHYQFEGMLNAPLGDTVAVRVAARYRKDGGYIRNLVDGFKFGGRENVTLRGKIAFEPSDVFSAVAMVQYDDTERSQGGNAQFLDPVFCVACGGSAYDYPLADPYTTVANVLNDGVGGKDRSLFFNLKMNYDLGAVAVSSVTAYRDTDNVETGDFDFTENDVFNLLQDSGAKTFTQDLTLTSDLGGAVEFIAGGSYLKDKSRFALAFPLATDFPNPAPAVENIVRTESISVFGEVTVTPVPRLSLTAGGRYTHDKRKLEGIAERSFSSFTPRFVIAYDTGAVNVYASYNEGFKAGGFNTPAFGPPANSVEGEDIKSYEVGVKFVTADRSLRVNLAAFKYDYSNLQVTAIDQQSGGSVLQNAASASGQGIEGDFDIRPADWFNVFGGFSYLDAKYDDFQGAQVQVPLFDAGGNPTGLGVGFADLSGMRLARAPEWTAFIGATIKSDIGNNWKGELTGFVNMTASYDFAPGGGGPLQADRQPGYALAKLSARIMPVSERFTIGAFVDNLFDKVYYDFRFTTAPFGAEQVVARPRTYGISLSANF